MRRLTILSGRALVIALLCSALNVPAHGAEKPALTIASFAGGFSQAQKQSIFDVYTEESGIDIDVRLHTGGTSAFMADPENKVVPQVVALDLGTAQQACTDGLIIPIEAEEVVRPEKGVTLEEDFVPFGITDCAVANSVNSLVIVFDRTDYPKDPPSSPEDFFDLEKFPGTRGLRPHPHSALVLALLAAGTEPENVYKTLESAQGVETAFRMLRSIERNIVWWRTGQQSVDYLATNIVTMTTAFHSWAYRSRVMDGRPLGLVWNGQQAEVDVWAIPAAAGKQSLAANFIRFASDKERLAAQSNLMPYGPGRRSAFPLINDEMREHLPNTPEHGDAIVWVDHAWWREHGTPLAKRFAVWVAKTDQL